ncbi:MAG: SAM-dependent methyltransferase [Deltaproteobacteria bacterium HGW-Deltaproteobacteria-14]|jgi:predicted methyltransferase|nr:MAG: SAM-dependent methyltransferase [Deltaproteobacteria bacterium HGW-Deltaproteobacteria-14]
MNSTTDRGSLQRRSRSSRRLLLCLLVVPALGLGCGHAAPAVEGADTARAGAAALLEGAQRAVASPDRSEADRALDVGRHPAETLAFLQIGPGMKVAEIGAGGGYSSELLARVVGPSGRVYGVNSPFVLEKFAEKPWSERLEKPVMARVTRLDRPFDDPFPNDFDDMGRLDAVVNILFYHDTFWMGLDRAAMNAAIFAALEPGGSYGIVDHAARPEDGDTATKTLHRIDERVVIAEITAAGFVLEAEADFLRNPEDARDWSASPGFAGERRGTSDRFVLRFRKPR